MTVVERALDLCGGVFAIRLAVMNDLALELSKAEGETELLRLSVELGLERLGFDRVRLGLFEPGNPGSCLATYGSDETGELRDERGSRFLSSFKLDAEGSFRGCPLRFRSAALPHAGAGQRSGGPERAAAIIWDGEVALGELVADNLPSGRPIDGGALELLVVYARIVGHLLRKARGEEELRREATTDLLTGVMNRRVALMFLEKQVGLAYRKGEELSIAFIDLDGLKAVNDSQGHAEGDAYLAAIADLLLSSLRATDCVGRLGGDEFLVVFPDCPADNAAAVMRRIARQAVEHSSAAGKAYAYSLSWGLASLNDLGRRPADAAVEGAEAAASTADTRGVWTEEPEAGRSREALPGAAKATAALVELADRRMYESKITRGGSRR